MLAVQVLLLLLVAESYLSQVNSAISVRVFGMHFLPYCFPGGLQPLTPGAPGRIEVCNNCMECGE